MRDRRTFLDERREICRQRFDQLHAPVYDDNWGAYLNPSHERFVGRLAVLVPSGGEVLDAACGTGKYWPMLLAGGIRVFGTDHSAGMLARCAAKLPEVPTRRLALQDLAGATDLHGRFAAAMCVDAMECVGPEDWPHVLAGLCAVVGPGSPVYLTVEVPEEPVPEVAGLAPGEVVVDGSYHFYPTESAVLGWLNDAGLTVTAWSVADGYLHLLARTSA